MLAESDCDPWKAVLGRHTGSHRKKGPNAVVLDPDVANEFRDLAAVIEPPRSSLRMSVAPDFIITLQRTSDKRPPSMPIAWHQNREDLSRGGAG